MKNKIKKYVASLFVAILFGIYFTYRSMLGVSQNTVVVKPIHTVPVQNPPVVIFKPISGYADGTYVGDSVDAFYGNVQVQITVRGGVITNSVALDSPGDRSQSLRINSRAIPRLSSEVISAQNPKIDAVSGATYTSVAYKKSLTSALSQARI